MKKYLFLMHIVITSINAANAPKIINPDEIKIDENMNGVFLYENSASAENIKDIGESKESDLKPILNTTTIDIADAPMPKELQDLLDDSQYFKYLKNGNYGMLSQSVWFTDPYHNLRLVLSDSALSQDDSTLRLIQQEIVAIVNLIKSLWTHHGCYVHFSHYKIHTVEQKILTEDFEPYDWDRNAKEMSYLFKNGRDIPHLDSAFITASIFIVRKNLCNLYELLIINENEKKDLTVPAGHINGGELSYQGLIREVIEEIGLKIEEHDLKLFHLRNGTGLGNGSQNHVDFTFYAKVPYETIIEVDGKEVSNFMWVPLNEIKTKKFEITDENGEIIAAKGLSNLYKSILFSNFQPGELWCSSPQSPSKRLMIPTMRRSVSFEESLRKD